MPDLSNDMIAERLGWTKHMVDAELNKYYWRRPDGSRLVGKWRELPDWLHDLNAAFPLLLQVEDAEVVLERDDAQHSAMTVFTIDFAKPEWDMSRERRVYCYSAADLATAICQQWWVEQEADDA